MKKANKLYYLLILFIYGNNGFIFICCVKQRMRKGLIKWVKK